MTQRLFPVLIIALIFAAPSSANADESAVFVVHFINGALGDGSFFDSAARGIAEAEAELGIEVVTIEAGYNSQHGGNCWRLPPPARITTS